MLPRLSLPAGKTYTRVLAALALMTAFLPGLALVARAAEAPANLASLARISADAQYNDAYKAANVADGQVQASGSNDDAGRAWCVNGADHPEKATLVFEWSEEIQVKEIVFYGRTAFFPNEFWSHYEIFTGQGRKPVFTGDFLDKWGPQRIILPRAFKTSILRIRFSKPFGGANPGASEVLVFASSPTDDQLPAYVTVSTGTPVGPNPEEMKDEARNREIEALPQSQGLRDALLSGALGFEDMLVVQRQPLNASHVYTYHTEGFASGGGLYRFTPDVQGGELHTLVDSPEGQIMDCDLSFDGREILFSWRKDVAATYQIYTINADGSNLKQLTDDVWHNFNGAWLPDGDIVFLSTRRPAFAYCWTSPVGVLHQMDRDGGNVTCLSANYLNDFTPTVTHDGRIIYGRWEYVDRPAIPIQGLWTINPDGTDLAQYYGNRVLSPATFMEARSIPGSGRMLCTMTAHNGPCRGAVGTIDPAFGDNAQESIRNLTPDISIGKVDEGSGNSVKGPYENPCPLDERSYLVSRGGTIQLRDYDNTRLVTLLEPRDGLGFYNPRPLTARVKPRVIPSMLPKAQTANLGEGQPLATVYLQDVYRGLEPWVKRGEVKQIAVVQEIEKSRLADIKQQCFGFQFPVVSCGATYAPKKVWGYAPVDEDGSASFHVPAGMPIYFMALDAQGRAVQRMRSFTHLMPGERQGCIGCHESRNQSPAISQRPTAFMREPVDLQVPEWGLKGFNYNQIVQPVLDANCVQCHGPGSPPMGLDLSGDLTDYFNVSYDHLARMGTVAEDAHVLGVLMKDFGASPYTRWIPTYNGTEESIPVITPKVWGSPASKLAEVIVSGHPDQNGEPRIHLDEASRRRILAWIDLNVPYYGTSVSNYPDNKGCRRIYPPDLDAVLNEVAQRRCVECHSQVDAWGKVQLPRKFWLRLTHPEANNFLTAPLSKEASGTGMCGRAVFASTRDPDYQAILKTFEPVAAMLAANPRADQIDGDIHSACTTPGAVVSCAAGTCVSSSIGLACPLAPVSSVAQSMAITDYGNSKVFLIDADGRVSWEYDAVRPQDVWVLPSGNILLAQFQAVQEVTPDKKVVWEYRTESPNEIHSCQPLPDGGVLIGELGTCRLIEVGRKGEILKEIKVETTIDAVHMQFRLCRKTPEGTYLVALTGEGVVRELDGEGRTLRTIPAGPLVYGATRLPGGNTLIGCGEGHRIIEVDSQGDIVWEINENDLPGNPLRFVAGLQRLANGNTLVCNWGGFGHIGEQPQLFEVTPGKKIVWQLFDNEHFGTITNVHGLEGSGQPLR